MLPIEMYREMLKYSPQFYGINKEIYDRNLFYQYQCDQPISRKELIDYIKLIKPQNFMIFVDNITDYIAYNFDIFDKNWYIVTSRTLFSTGSNIDYNYGGEEKPMLIDKALNKYITDLFRYNLNVKLDIYTTYNILKRRKSCILINKNYAKEYTISLLNIKNINIIGIDTFFKWSKQLFYLSLQRLAAYPEDIQDVDIKNLNEMIKYSNEYNKTISLDWFLSKL